MFTTAGYLTTPSGNIDIVGGPIYLDADGLDVGVVLRRQVATSPFVDGRVLVASVKDHSERTLTFNVVGNSVEGVRGSVTTLIYGLTQDTYELHLSVDGEDSAWRCEPADYVVSLNASDAQALVCTVRATIPMHPVPVAGPF